MNKKMNLNWSVDEITGNMPDISFMRSKEFQVKETSNTELLKDYLKRLGNGEDLESVKKDFVQNFSDVEASEIMKAEQELIKEGTPITEVQKLCDVHSALFHGLTKEEKIANAEKAVEESLKKEERSEMKIMPDAYVNMSLQKHSEKQRGILFILLQKKMRSLVKKYQILEVH